MKNQLASTVDKNFTRMWDCGLHQLDAGKFKNAGSI